MQGLICQGMQSKRKDTDLSRSIKYLFEDFPITISISISTMKNMVNGAVVNIDNSDCMVTLL